MNDTLVGVMEIKWKEAYKHAALDRGVLEGYLGWRLDELLREIKEAEVQPDHVVEERPC